MKSPSQHPIAKSIGEWGSCFIEGASLDAQDRRLATRLTEEPKGRLAIDELHNGVRITARSWVGLVQFSAFQLQIVAKLAGDNLNLVELIDYATGLDALARYPGFRSISGTGTSLFDLIALLFVEACERALRAGLLSDYCEVEDDLPVVRGRLLVRQQVLKRFGKIDRLECRYDEYLTNIPENQIVLAGLSVCASRVGNALVAMRVRRLLTIMSEACSLHDCDWQQTRKTLIYNRMNEHYRESHDLAWLILDGLGIEDIFAGGAQRCYAFLLDMNRLFENFVTRWFRELFRNSLFQVIPQAKDRSIIWDANLQRPYKAVIPDLLIQAEPGRSLPVDAKYKLYDEEKLSSADIYQMFLYAFAYGEAHPVRPTALVVYPASSTSGGYVRLHIRQRGSASAELRVVPIHIPTALKEARLRTGSMGDAVIAAVSAAFGEPKPTASL